MVTKKDGTPVVICMHVAALVVAFILGVAVDRTIGDFGYASPGEFATYVYSEYECGNTDYARVSVYKDGMTHSWQTGYSGIVEGGEE